MLVVLRDSASMKFQLRRTQNFRDNVFHSSDNPAQALRKTYTRVERLRRVYCESRTELVLAITMQRLFCTFIPSALHDPARSECAKVRGGVEWICK